MNIVNRRYKYLFVVFISIAFLTGCASKIHSETNTVSGSATSEQVYSKEDAYRLLTNAKEIKLYKQVFSLHDYWEVYADGVQVAKVEGKYIYLIGDTYQMTSTNGDVMFSEEENFRVILRGAGKYDSENQKIGSYDQEWSWWLYHMATYDKNNIKVAELQQKFTLLETEFDICNATEDACFHAEKSFFSFADEYTIVKIKPNQIPIEDVVFMTMITNEVLTARNEA